ncbi:hypothetical protein MIMGU_mgv1a024226mg [Erythranthe guttata]|uniref:Glycosyltransferase n=1 Tax=Erythranthe guttata TaxID=4155 RepID=A0A022PXP2_ERYGU|nr:hypothetical protein MIMGU_mgv1a024226mg [Erythranthe guttata]
MAETILVYASAEHLNTMLPMSVAIGKHHPSISVVLLSTAAAASSAAAAAAPAVNYRLLPTPALPPNSDHFELFFEIPRLNNPILRDAIEEISKESNIKAIIIDVFCNPAFEVCTSFGIPTYFCNTTGASALWKLLHWPTIHDTIPGAADSLKDFDYSIEIPGCPLLQLLDLPKVFLFPQSNSYKHLVCTSMNMRKSAGIIVNTYHALEFRAMEALANGLCSPGVPTPPVYSLAPFINSEKDSSSGGGGGGAEAECFRWLDLQPIKSVVFLCFGRRDRGILLKGYAPQMEVLSHESLGGFVTHCGQGSLLEAVWFGVPMIGWPLYAEQRVNRVFMVEEMKVALPLEEAEDGFVTAAELEKRVRELMDSKTGTEVRRRVTEMKHSAAAAVAKGGSTVVAMEKFIEAFFFVKFPFR